MWRAQPSPRRRRELCCPALDWGVGTGPVVTITEAGGLCPALLGRAPARCGVLEEGITTSPGCRIWGWGESWPLTGKGLWGWMYGRASPSPHSSSLECEMTHQTPSAVAPFGLGCHCLGRIKGAGKSMGVKSCQAQKEIKFTLELYTRDSPAPSW